MLLNRMQTIPAATKVLVNKEKKHKNTIYKRVSSNGLGGHLLCVVDVLKSIFMQNVSYTHL